MGKSAAKTEKYLNHHHLTLCLPLKIDVLTEYLRLIAYISDWVYMFLHITTSSILGGAWDEIKFVLYCIDGVVIAAQMHCNNIEIYCAPPN